MLDKYELTGKTALVTGGGGLLGRQHGLALAECGASVVMADIDPASADAAAREIGQTFPTIKAIGAGMDVSKEESIKESKAEIENRVGEVSILINNAAVNPKVTSDGGVEASTRIENFDVEDWEFQVSVGLTGAILCSKIFGASMAKRGGGVILNIASDLAVIAPNQSLYQKDGLAPSEQPVKPVSYSVIKSGLVGLTKYLSTYWVDQGVRVNCLSPGGVFNGQADDFVENLASLIPMKRMAGVDEYRGALQFLCSEASSYMNGQNMIIDGGRSVW